MANENKTSNSNKSSNKTSNNNESGYTPKTSDPVAGGFSFDNIPEIVDGLVSKLFRQLEPKVHEFVMGYANRFAGAGTQLPNQLVSRARTSPIYTIGAVALVLAGVGLMLTDHSSVEAPKKAKDLH
jgi:hypothetical protein